MLAERLASMVTYNPRAIPPDATLARALSEMHGLGIHHLPVVYLQRRILGILSDEDAIRSASAWQESNGAPQTIPTMKVAEIMVREVATVDHDDDPGKALCLMRRHKVHSVPVVEDEQLVAMLTSTDFLREFSYGELSVCSEPVGGHLVRSRCYIDVARSIDEAARMMSDNRVRELIVLDGDRPLGVLGVRQLRRARMRQLVNRHPWLRGPDTPAEVDITLARLVAGQTVLDLHASLGEAASGMLEQRAQALAVLGQSGKLVGMVSEDHVLAAFAAATST